jgi:hypothetical protein
MSLTAPEPISTAYLKRPSHQSVCLYVYPPIVARQEQRSRCNEYTPNNRKIIGHVVSYAVRVLSKESGLLILPGISCSFYKGLP